MLARRRRPDGRLRDGGAGRASDGGRRGEPSEASGGEAAGRGVGGARLARACCETGEVTKRRPPRAWRRAATSSRRRTPFAFGSDSAGVGAGGRGCPGPSQPARPPQLLSNSGITIRSSRALLLPSGFPGCWASNPRGFPSVVRPPASRGGESVAPARRHPPHPAAAAAAACRGRVRSTVTFANSRGTDVTPTWMLPTRKPRAWRGPWESRSD